TVPGTFIFRSILPGSNGDLTFTGDEDLINTFALNVVKESSTAAFRASIYDAHTGTPIATNVKVSDNKLIGVLHPNVDIEFDATANIKATWSEQEKNFILEPETDAYESIIHLVDSSTIFQIGANEGEDIAIDIGNMSAGSLGVTNINVTTRESASKAIGMIDAAINKVSSQRAKIGAYQNALEYTSENLTTTMTNLTAAESRIRDADMAQEMMNFVKLQILNQSGTSMLAQANQLPQSVLSLLQG
ncbi:MAG: flagellin, partial [Synergistaceae bacterium]|nr:flagellin [Synergistaceae bacterium]